LGKSISDPIRRYRFGPEVDLVMLFVVEIECAPFQQIIDLLNKASGKYAVYMARLER